MGDPSCSGDCSVSTIELNIKTLDSQIHKFQVDTKSHATTQAPQGNETGGSGNNAGGTGPTGNQTQSGIPPSGQSVQPPPRSVQITRNAAAVPLPSFLAPIPYSMSTLSEFMTQMERALTQNGYEPNSATNAGDTPRPELPSNSLRLPTVEAMAIVLRHAERLLSGHAIAALSHIAGRLEREGATSDPTIRGQIQSESVQIGLAMQHLGALLLELGRTILTLRMGQSPVQSSVNAGPSVYISPSERVTKVSATSWSVKEDIALMSSYIFCSEDSRIGKNQKCSALWTRVSALYNEAQAEKPEELRERNVEQMKGRFKRLNANAQKWIDAYKQAIGRKQSGMSMADVEREAQSLYSGNTNVKFSDLIVFNEVMCKHPKWSLDVQHDATYCPPEVEQDFKKSGRSSKRTRMTDEGDDYSIPSNPDTSVSGSSSSMVRPIGGDAAKKRRGKEKIVVDDVAVEIRALRMTRQTDVELMNKRLKAEKLREQSRIERQQQKCEMKQIEMQMKQMDLLTALIAKEHLAPEDEDMKRHLMSILYGK